MTTTTIVYITILSLTVFSGIAFSLILYLASMKHVSSKLNKLLRIVDPLSSSSEPNSDKKSSDNEDTVIHPEKTNAIEDIKKEQYSDLSARYVCLLVKQRDLLDKIELLERNRKDLICFIYDNYQEGDAPLPEFITEEVDNLSVYYQSKSK